MDTILWHPDDALTAPAPTSTSKPASKGVLGTLAWLLEEMVHANGKLLPSADRELPPEWFHYPLV